MRNYKNITIILFITLFTSVLAPTITYAASLDDGPNHGVIDILVGFLVGELDKILHINPTSAPDDSTPGLPEASSGPCGSKDVLGFYAEWYGEDTASYSDLVKHTDAIGTIAPFWATLHQDGSVTNRGGDDHASVVKYAHNNNVTTLLMVNNANQNSPDNGIHAVLANPAVRKTAIDNLEAVIKKNGLDGINIDFEQVPADDRDNLTAFVRELSARLKPENYIVSIDVFPKHNEENDVAVPYDYAQLARYADKIILMTYDYHGDWNGPGAIADIRSVEADLRYALGMIPKNKIYLGVAGYGYDWSSKGTESLEYDAIQNLISRFGPDVQWDDASQSPHFKYTGPDGVTHQVWYENSQSLKFKLNLVNEYDIAGIALWRLGGEDPASWSVVRDSLKH